MDAAFLSEKFQLAQPYDAYVRTGTEEQQRRWQQVYEIAQATDAQRRLIASFTRKMNILTVSGVWCGDCVQQVPLIARVAEANPDKIDHRIVDREAVRDLMP